MKGSTCAAPYIFEEIIKFICPCKKFLKTYNLWGFINDKIKVSFSCVFINSPDIVVRKVVGIKTHNLKLGIPGLNFGLTKL